MSVFLSGLDFGYRFRYLKMNGATKKEGRGLTNGVTSSWLGREFAVLLRCPECPVTVCSLHHASLWATEAGGSKYNSTTMGERDNKVLFVCVCVLWCICF